MFALITPKGLGSANPSTYCAVRRTRGIAGSAVDFLICAAAHRRGWAILTTNPGCLTLRSAHPRGQHFFLPQSSHPLHTRLDGLSVDPVGHVGQPNTAAHPGRASGYYEYTGSHLVHGRITSWLR
jgi:hypothetical protein